MTNPWAPIDVGDWAPSNVDIRTPHAARMYNYALGGKDNYAVDREAVEKLSTVIPDALLAALENRAFLGRAVRVLAEAGVRQFIDVGSGLPTQSNVHEVAREVAPDACVVYSDYDPIVVAHSRELLSGVGNAAAIQADMRRPQEILKHPALGGVIDFDQPVAVLLVAVLHLVTDDEDPAGIVAQFREVLPPGSYLALSQFTYEDKSPEEAAHWRNVFEAAAEPMVQRTREDIRGFFDGFEFLAPGLVTAAEWRPDIPSAIQSPETGWILAGVGRKP